MAKTERSSLRSSSTDDGAKKGNKTYVTLIILSLAVCGKPLFQDGFFNERKSCSKKEETFNKSHRETTVRLCFFSLRAATFFPCLHTLYIIHKLCFTFHYVLSLEFFFFFFQRLTWRSIQTGRNKDWTSPWRGGRTTLWPRRHSQVLSPTQTRSTAALSGRRASSATWYGGTTPQRCCSCVASSQNGWECQPRIDKKKNNKWGVKNILSYDL